MGRSFPGRNSARFDSGFRGLVLRHDPLVLLRMDSASLPESEREEIVEALLEATSEVRVVDPAIHHSHLPSLRHGELAAQLSRWLLDNNGSDSVKELAVEIAEKTRLTGIAGLLWQLYPEATGRLRVRIADALYQLAEEGFDEEWKAVLRDGFPQDEEGRLLGAALEIMAVDSGKMALREVIDAILPDRKFRVWGLYAMVVRNLHKQLTPEDLPAVFAKLGERPRLIHDSLSVAKEFNEAAVRLAFRNFGRPEVAAALADYWHACIRDHAHPHHNYNTEWMPTGLGVENDAGRREIALALVSHPDFERNTEKRWVQSGVAGDVAQAKRGGGHRSCVSPLTQTPASSVPLR